ncbi:predicted protein [Botrytis cinerea T4]|uniref:Uncharacterized protein n=1 Tax=Botryotinia fuckeliana (strain T4) TaxID=999810 RepID=G2YDQ0_BOTF4|nr:predicted protein [Botrytis cinerea T4]
MYDVSVMYEYMTSRTALDTRLRSHRSYAESPPPLTILNDARFRLVRTAVRADNGENGW